MRIVRKNPIDYDLLCRQTVTVYHKEGTGYTRKVYRKAFFQFKKLEEVAKTGSKDGTSFLLVIPGDTQSVFPGDKILEGEGPVLTSPAEWAAFIPVRVPGLAVAKSAAAYKWEDRIVHTEAEA